VDAIEARTGTKGPRAIESVIAFADERDGGRVGTVILMSATNVKYMLGRD
jgi:hypothetical protein